MTLPPLDFSHTLYSIAHSTCLQFWQTERMHLLGTLEAANRLNWRVFYCAQKNLPSDDAIYQALSLAQESLNPLINRVHQVQIFFRDAAVYEHTASSHDTCLSLLDITLKAMYLTLSELITDITLPLPPVENGEIAKNDLVDGFNETLSHQITTHIRPLETADTWKTNLDEIASLQVHLFFLSKLSELAHPLLLPQKEIQIAASRIGESLIPACKSSLEKLPSF